ncbi:MAG: hypothetical protein ACKO01_06750 [Erythrobacter sp.]
MMRWRHPHPHRLLTALREAQGICAEFPALIGWRGFDRRSLGERLTIRDFEGLAVGCGNDPQAVIALMGAERGGGTLDSGLAISPAP